MILFAITCGCTLALITASITTGRSPLTLCIRAALALQGALIWLRLDAWPAIWRERHQYRYRVAEAHRRLYETPPQAEQRAAQPDTPAKQESAAPPSPGLWERLKGLVEA